MTTNGDGYSTLHVLKGKTTKKAIPIFGTIAQLVEQRTENPCVPGSIPGGTTEQCSLTYWKNQNGPSVQLEWTPPCHGGDHGFESRMDRKDKIMRMLSAFTFRLLTSWSWVRVPHPAQ